jgi:hypothetical protein
MKKIICLIVIALMVASVALAAEKITAKDLAGLKGTWVGMLDFGMSDGRGTTTACTLEILNDTVPVQAKLTLWNVPRYVAEASGVFEGRNEFDLNDGQLTSQGAIFWPSPEAEKNKFEVSMSSEKKLNATYSFRTKSGSAVLRKK